MNEKLTSFQRTFFDVISMGEKSKLSQRTFFDVISKSEKSMPFLCTFLNLISMDKKIDVVSMYFLSNFDGKFMPLVVVLTSLLEKFFDISKTKAI